MKGNKPTYGKVTIKNGKVISANICIGGYMVNYDGKEATSGNKCIETEDTTEPVIIIGTISGTTNSLNIPFIVKDNETGIEEVKCSYKLDTESIWKKGKIEDNVCKLTGLKSEQIYNFEIEAINGSGMSKKETRSKQTGNFTEIEITPSSIEWKASKTVTISGSTEGATLEYRVVSGTEIKKDWTTYKDKIIIDWAANTEVPTYIYARFNDGVNTSNEETFTITTVDTTAPILTLGSASSTTNIIVIPINENSDPESGIKNTTCVYGTSTSYGLNGTIETNNCSITGLKNNTTYYYSVTTTNNAGTEETKTGSIKTGDFGGITITTSSTDWTTSKTVTISGSTSGATLEYRVVSGTEEKQDWTTYSNAIAIDWAANTEVPTYVYARFNDGTNTSAEETLTITTVDITAPKCTLSINTYTLDNVILKATCTDLHSGIKNYQYNIENGDYITSTTNTYKFESIKISTIKVKVTDKIGNSKEYVLTGEEKERVYEGLYNLLNEKYNDLNNNSFLYSHPVGSIYITTSADENTASKIASKYGGAWEVYGENRVLKGTIGSASAIGGNSNVSSISINHTHNYSHTHTIPSHYHNLSDSNVIAEANLNITAGELYIKHGNKGGTTFTSNYGIDVTASSATVSTAYGIGVFGITDVKESMTTNTQSTTTTGTMSANSTINAEDPYITVYMYRRIEDK